MVTVLTLLLAAVALAGSPAGLSQEPGKAGCISASGSKGRCENGRALIWPTDVAVSPDGWSVYVAASGSESLAVFERSLGTGRLRQRTGRAGCVAKGAIDGCAHGVAVGVPNGVAVSPDGKNVYLAANGSIATFDRDRRTGDLVQKEGLAGCLSPRGADGHCRIARGTGRANDVAVSPDGKDVYAATDAGVAIFERDPRTGTLRQVPGAAGCILVEGRSGDCGVGRGLDDPVSLVVSPDGRNVYVASYSSGSIAIFARDPAGGTLTQMPGTAGCISEGGSAGTCREDGDLAGAATIAISPDGKSVYVTASEVGVLSIFRRHQSDGALSRPRGRAACIAERGSADGCRPATDFLSPQGVAVAPDGRSVYVIGEDSLTTFRRDRQGALTQEAGKAGCISAAGSGGHCGRAAGLADGFRVAVSPDGDNVYGVGMAANAVTVFR